MARSFALLALILGAALVAVVLVGAREDEDESYRVRAIFENAGFVIADEDVKVAGVKVGRVDSVEVTDDFKAAIVLDIEEPGFQDFRKDASCRVRPQSLIGERFVECTPTRKRAVGAPAPGPLERIEDGPGEGQYLLPATQTEQSVDLDLINNIYRLPYRQRLSIIINEFGGALAGRGEDLGRVIRQGNPALREVQEVLRILATQNDELERLARDSDRALAPLARERESLGRFVESSADLGQATIERRAELEASFQRLPRFLRELRPTMRDLGAVADQASPVLSDLEDVAPQLNAFVGDLGPFSQAALPALDTLGDAGRVGVEALEASRPVLRQTTRLGEQLRPVGRTLADVLTSFERNDGIERFMDLTFNTVSAANGFDAFGHYLRASLIVNTCSSYAVTPVSGCEANFLPEQATATAASGKPRDKVLARTAAVLRGADPATLMSSSEQRAMKKLRSRVDQLRREGERGSRARDARPAPAAPTPTPQAAATPAPSDREARDQALLDYLFGKDAP